MGGQVGVAVRSGVGAGSQEVVDTGLVQHLTRGDDLLDDGQSAPVLRTHQRQVGPPHQVGGGGALSELAGEFGGPQQQRGAPGGGGGQLRAAFESGDGDGDGAPGARPGGERLQFGDDVLVGSEGGCHPVPDLPVRVGLQDGGQRRVDRQPFRDRGAAVDRGADQRVAEPHPQGVRKDQGVVDGGLERRGTDGGAAGDARGAQELGQVAAGVGGRRQEQGPGVRREVGVAGPEGTFEALVEREEVDRLPGDDVGAGQASGEFDEGQRVAGRLLQDQGALPGGQLRCGAREQRPRGAGVQRSQWQFAQARAAERIQVPGACGGQDEDGVGGHPARHEGQYVGAGAVEPLGVVGDGQHRGERGALGDELQRGQRDAEQIGNGTLRAEGGSQGPALARLQPVRVRPERTQELVQAGEGHPALGFDPQGGEHGQAPPRRTVAGRGEQGGLADAGAAAEHQCASPAALRLVEQLLQQGGLLVPAEEFALTVGGGRGLGQKAVHGLLTAGGVGLGRTTVAGRAL